MSKDIRNFFGERPNLQKKRKADEIVALEPKITSSPKKEKDGKKRLKKLAEIEESPSLETVNLSIDTTKTQKSQVNHETIIENGIHNLKVSGTANQDSKRFEGSKDCITSTSTKPKNGIEPQKLTSIDAYLNALLGPFEEKHSDSIPIETNNVSSIESKKTPDFSLEESITNNKKICSPEPKPMNKIEFENEKKHDSKSISSVLPKEKSLMNMIEIEKRNEQIEIDNKDKIKSNGEVKAKVEIEVENTLLLTSKDKPSDKSSLMHGILNGYTFAIAGLFDNTTKKGLEEIIKTHDGKVSKIVDEKTFAVIMGYLLENGKPIQTSIEYKQAKELGIKIMSDIEFDDFLFTKSGHRFINRTNNVLSSIQDVSSCAKKTNDIKKDKGIVTSAKSSNFIPKEKVINEKSSELWTIKYAPKTLAEIVGNQTSIKCLREWLEDWERVVINGLKKDTKFDSKKGKDYWSGGNINSRACLISGPPGIGKTTAARLVARELGFEIVEKNASDVRNKTANEELLNHLTSNNLFSFKKDTGLNKKFVIIMDEVDGMSSGDRGGNKVLIDNIKTTKVPILCICNDRMHPKIRSLANHCYDIKFQNPTKNLVIKRMVDITMKEEMKIDPNSLDFICENFGNDIRQILNFLEIHSKKSKILQYSDAKSTCLAGKKDQKVIMSHFDAGSKFLTKSDMNLRDKMDLFFVDYDMIPLLIQENYLSCGNLNTNQSNLTELGKIATAADFISRSDVVGNFIRTFNDWTLMPNFGFLSTIAPADLVANNMPKPKFPEWLGKFSHSRKIARETKELSFAISPVITGTRFAVKQEYSKALLDLILYNLKTNGKDSVETVLDIMEYYNINPDILKEHLVDLQLKSTHDPFDEIPAQVKSLITRTYNQRYKSSVKKTKKTTKADMEGFETNKFDPNIDDEPIKTIGDDLEKSEQEDSKSDDEEIMPENIGIKSATKKKAESKIKSVKSGNN